MVEIVISFYVDLAHSLWIKIYSADTVVLFCFAACMDVSIQNMMNFYFVLFCKV